MPIEETFALFLHLLIQEGCDKLETFKMVSKLMDDFPDLDRQQVLLRFHEFQDQHFTVQNIDFKQLHDQILQQKQQGISTFQPPVKAAKVSILDQFHICSLTIGHQKPSESYTSVRFLGDQYLVSASDDGVVKLWQIVGGQLFLRKLLLSQREHSNTLYSLKTSECGRYVSALFEDWVVVWDLLEKLQLLETSQQAIQSAISTQLVRRTTSGQKIVDSAEQQNFVAAASGQPHLVVQSSNALYFVDLVSNTTTLIFQLEGQDAKLAWSCYTPEFRTLIFVFNVEEFIFVGLVDISQFNSNSWSVHALDQSTLFSGRCFAGKIVFMRPDFPAGVLINSKFGVQPSHVTVSPNSKHLIVAIKNMSALLQFDLPEIISRAANIMVKDEVLVSLKGPLQTFLTFKTQPKLLSIERVKLPVVLQTPIYSVVSVLIGPDSDSLVCQLKIFNDDDSNDKAFLVFFLLSQLSEKTHQIHPTQVAISGGQGGSGIAIAFFELGQTQAFNPNQPVDSQFLWLLSDAYNFDEFGAIELANEQGETQVLTSNISDLYLNFISQDGSQQVNCLKIPGIFPDFQFSFSEIVCNQNYIVVTNLNGGIALIGSDYVKQQSESIQADIKQEQFFFLELPFLNQYRFTKPEKQVAIDRNSFILDFKFQKLLTISDIMKYASLRKNMLFFDNQGVIIWASQIAEKEEQLFKVKIVEISLQTIKQLFQIYLHKCGVPNVHDRLIQLKLENTFIQNSPYVQFLLTQLFNLIDPFTICSLTRIYSFDISAIEQQKYAFPQILAFSSANDFQNSSQVPNNQVNNLGMMAFVPKSEFLLHKSQFKLADYQVELAQESAIDVFNVNALPDSLLYSKFKPKIMDGYEVDSDDEYSFSMESTTSRLQYEEESTSSSSSAIQQQKLEILSQLLTYNFKYIDDLLTTDSKDAQKLKLSTNFLCFADLIYLDQQIMSSQSLFVQQCLQLPALQFEFNNRFQAGFYMVSDVNYVYCSGQTVKLQKSQFFHEDHQIVLMKVGLVPIQIDDNIQSIEQLNTQIEVLKANFLNEFASIQDKQETKSITIFPLARSILVNVEDNNYVYKFQGLYPIRQIAQKLKIICGFAPLNDVLLFASAELSLIVQPIEAPKEKANRPKAQTNEKSSGESSYVAEEEFGGSEDNETRVLDWLEEQQKTLAKMQSRTFAQFGMLNRNSSGNLSNFRGSLAPLCEYFAQTKQISADAGVIALRRLEKAVQKTVNRHPDSEQTIRRSLLIAEDVAALFSQNFAARLCSQKQFSMQIRLPRDCAQRGGLVELETHEFERLQQTLIETADKSSTLSQQIEQLATYNLHFMGVEEDASLDAYLWHELDLLDMRIKKTETQAQNELLKQFCSAIVDVLSNFSSQLALGLFIYPDFPNYHKVVPVPIWFAQIIQQIMSGSVSELANIIGLLLCMKGNNQLYNGGTVLKNINIILDLIIQKLNKLK